ncbi:hypothetical protein KSS87_000852, partial [Heliosperma pusillum]
MEFETLYVQAAKYECLLFDLDDTLYPLSSGLANGVLHNIHDYMVEKLGIKRSRVDDLSNLLYKNYGTTMAGLRLWHLLLLPSLDVFRVPSVIQYFVSRQSIYPH